MNKTWEEEISHMMNKINDETEKLLNANLPTDDFQKKHEELIAYWYETSQKIQQNYQFSLRPKARPKHKHHSHHMSEKYQIQKILSKFHQEI